MNTPTSPSPIFTMDRRRFLTSTIASLGAYPSIKAIAADETTTAPLGTVVITTPTGAIGSRVLRSLLDRGVPIRVIARDPAKIPAEIRDRLEVIEGSPDDQDVGDRVFKGAHS